MKTVVEDYKYSCKGEEMQLKDIQVFVKNKTRKIGREEIIKGEK